jgi:hypothetical protein
MLSCRFDKYRFFESNKSRRRPGDNCSGFHVTSYERARADDGAIADGYSGHDKSSSSYKCVLSNCDFRRGEWRSRVLKIVSPSAEIGFLSHYAFRAELDFAK